MSYWISITSRWCQKIISSKTDKPSSNIKFLIRTDGYRYIIELLVSLCLFQMQNN